MKAVVLAAGTGKRFRPLTATRPKPMLPVGSHSLLEHVTNSLANAGITDIVFVVGHQQERIQNHFGNGDQWDVNIEYVIQERPRGTGDALLQAEHTIGGDFLVVNGDRVVESSLLAQLSETRKATATNQIAVTQVADPTQYGMIECDGSDVRDIIEKPAPHAVTSQIVNVGAYAFGPDIFAAIRDTDTRGELALSTVLKQTLDTHPLNAITYDGTWFELTRPWDLLTANQTWLDQHGGMRSQSAAVHADATVVDPAAVGTDSHVGPGARIIQNVTLGPNVRVGANAVIENSVILEDTTIGPGTVVRDAVIGSNTVLGPNCTIVGGNGDVVVDETLYTDIQFGGLIGDDATLSGGVTVKPGTILDNGAAVDAQYTVSGTFPTTPQKNPE